MDRQAGQTDRPKRWSRAGDLDIPASQVLYSYILTTIAGAHAAQDAEWDARRDSCPWLPVPRFPFFPGPVPRPD
jgi:hypothetical protein